MNLPDFVKAFEDGANFSDTEEGPFQVYCKLLGKLNFPSGKIVACDPLVFPEKAAFKGKIAPGRYPVILSIARLGSGRTKDERVACAKLRISRREPVQWKMAMAPGQTLKALKKDRFYGYAVDSGTGCFMDAQAGKALCAEMDPVDDYFENIIDAMEENYVPTRDWAMFRIGRSSLVAAVFSTGFGDGLYGSYWGLDVPGKPSCLVTDFGVLPGRQE